MYKLTRTEGAFLLMNLVTNPVATPGDADWMSFEPQSCC
jgi:hypothetical protein